MFDLLHRSLRSLVEALRRREISSQELVAESLRLQRERGPELGAFKVVDSEAAEAQARMADTLLAGSVEAPPLCGIPISVKDLYGVEGFPTFAGTARRLPDSWSRDGWLVRRLRGQSAVFVGKTHTVELAFGAVGINPHWGTPRNPWGPDEHRIPGGSSSGAGVSLWEGAAAVALGTDTGGSIRIPAALTGTVGHRTTTGRWPTAGVVPLSRTLDAVGALTRSAMDAAYFFGAVDPAWGDPEVFLRKLSGSSGAGLRIAVPRCRTWRECPADIADVLEGALSELQSAGWSRLETEGELVDEAEDLYLHGGIAGAECRAFLERDLPGWIEILHPTVGERVREAPEISSEPYSAAMEGLGALRRAAGRLFEGADVLAVPAATLTPPPVSEMADLARYREVNRKLLQPTSSASILAHSAITIPVGLDRAGMPVGLQLVAPGGADEALLAAAVAAERVLGNAAERLGGPPTSL